MSPHVQHKKLPLVPERGTKLTREKLNEHFHSNLHFHQTWTNRFSEYVTHLFGTVTFLVLNAVFFLGWLAFNSGSIGTIPYDPFPHNFLTMTVSLEAIFLSIIVLISQNRQSKIAHVRQQMDFEIDVRSEEEITKMLSVLDELRHAVGIKTRDTELEAMKKTIDLVRMQQQAEKNGDA